MDGAAMVYNHNTHKQKTITFPKDLYAKIEKLAKKENRDFTKQTLYLLKKVLQEYEN
jgi:hypothetical protein